jgi:predicted nucleic-acid-binding protein
MIGVDTNVLARLFVSNVPSQHEASLRFFGQRSKDDPAYVSFVVVVELVWILRTVYDYPMDTIRLALTSLLDSPDIHLQDRDLLADAIAQSTQPKVDLVDVLIAGLAVLEGCATTVTFDRNAAKRIPGMELLA